MFLFSTLAVYSQKNKTNFNSISLGADFFSNIFLGDVKQHDFYPSSYGNFNEFRFSGALNAKKMFNNVYDIQGEIGLGKLAGIRREFGKCKHCSTVYSESIDTSSTKFKNRYFNYDASLLVNLSNLVLNTNRNEKSKIKVIGEFGLGLISFRSVRRNLENSQILALRGYESNYENNELKKRDRQTELYYKFAAHMIYPLNDNIDLSGKVKYYIANSDDLDVTHYSAKDVNGSKNDKFVTFALGLTFNLGAKKSSLHWYNPLDELYHTESKIKKKVQSMSRDSDGDGVADAFDKQNDTPEGVIVDGSGVPLDVDMDGVYDYQDEDLFTVKNAKVNAKSVEIDSDGDGVPDSRDLEKSAKNALVNYQGITVNKANPSDVGGVTILPSLFFNTSSANIRQEDFKRLALAARIIRDNPKEKYFVVGHADSRGTIEDNAELAKRRAQSAINYLVEAFGIDANRLEVVSKGETNPLFLKQGYDASSEYENYQIEAYLNEVNRRVDFIIKK
jgi:outer membrane protein OmpA-like peptidoglycan-associated protein